MKKIHIIILTFILSSAALSCKDSFLDQPALGAFDSRILATPDGVKNLLIGAYGRLQNTLQMSPTGFVMANVRAGETHIGSDPNDPAGSLEIEAYNVTSGNAVVATGFQWLYDGVSRTNDVIKYLDLTTTGLTDAERLQIRAEARFLRGHYHFWARRLWGTVPYIDETAQDSRVKNDHDILPEIEADLDFARKNLAITNTDLGRVNRWAAEAYYAQVLMYQNKYAAAKPIIEGIIANGITNRGERYGLMTSYLDNFKAATKNNKESVFAVQSALNDVGVNALNGEQNSMPYNNPNAPGAGGWGWNQPSQWFVQHFRVDATGLPLLNNFTDVLVKNDDGLEASAPYTPDTTIPLDPRLDWTVARRGIPFNDYGVMPGKSWIRNQQNGGPYLQKKWSFNRSEVGSTVIYSGSNTKMAINATLIRFSDILLWAAEIEAQIGSLDRARDYVNQIRGRVADNPSIWVKNTAGTGTAANYVISRYTAGAAGDAFTSKETAMNAILMERYLELGLEGRTFYDLQRMGKATDIIGSYITYEKQYRSQLRNSAFEVTDQLLPIPLQGILNSLLNGEATLKQNPGYE